jgi:hypothetical protein
MNVQRLAKKIKVLSERARSLEAGRGGMTAEEYLSKMTNEIIKANPAMKFNEAFTQAQKDNPELAVEYLNNVGC